MVNRADRGRRVAAFATLPFQLRGLAPIAQRFESWLLTSSVDALEAWAPDLVLANDAGSFAMLRQYCDRHFAWLVGLRHGIANKYIGPDPEFALADYVCGSEWDAADFARHGVRPIRGMLVTGNPWVDDVFQVPPRTPNHVEPSILFAPTWNPETSAAAFFDRDLVSAIRAVYPGSRIVIKPHPLMISPGHDEALFVRWVDSYRRAALADPLVCFVDDPAVSIASLYAAADILVSDGSSLVFEFALFERPILLYTSARRVRHWSAAWDPAAPANAMRDVGDQFATPTEFDAALRCAFERHSLIHRDRQRAYSRELHGEYRDGRSAERAAAALQTLPFLDVTVASRRPNARFISDLERTLRNSRVRATTAALPAALESLSLTLRPSATQRFADAHFVSYATRGGGRLPTPADLAAPMLSIAGAARPVNDEWVQTHGAARLVYSSNSPRPSWERHTVVSVDVDQGGVTTTHSVIVDVTENPSDIVVRVEAPGAARVGRRRFVTTDELVERAASDPEAARLLAARERQEVTAWRSAETSIASRVVDDGPPPSLLECFASWLAIDLKSQGVRTVGLFGAGSHTAFLLPIWQQWGGPPVRAVLISDPVTGSAAFHGVEVIPIDKLDVNSVDAVVLSSASHEGSMAETCERAVPELPVYAVWHHSDRTGPTSATDRQLYAIRRLVPFAVARCRRVGITRVSLAGQPADQRLATAVWEAWNGPEVVGSSDGPDMMIWCSPGTIDRASLRCGPSLRLWPDSRLPVAPGLLPRLQVAS